MYTNVVENSSNFTEYNQIWAEYIFTDTIPRIAPSLTEAVSIEEKNNNKNSIYTVRSFQRSDYEGDRIYMLHVSNLKLKKPYRQCNYWEFDIGSGPDVIRNVILPTAIVGISPSYTPTFTNGEASVIPYTYLDPFFNLQDCRLETKVDVDELYFTGWIYVGRNLQVLLDNHLPPFNDTLWILRDTKTGNKAGFDVSAEIMYKLPSDTFSDTEDSHTIVTTNILNQVISQHGRLDEGSLW